MPQGDIYNQLRLARKNEFRVFAATNLNFAFVTVDSVLTLPRRISRPIPEYRKPLNNLISVPKPAHPQHLSLPSTSKRDPCSASPTQALLLLLLITAFYAPLMPNLSVLPILHSDVFVPTAILHFMAAVTPRRVSEPNGVACTHAHVLWLLKIPPCDGADPVAERLVVPVRGVLQ